jgi:GntR family transcriptional regulator of arabinose operon
MSRLCMTTLQRDSNALPLHTQVAAILKERILSGRWRNGESIPTEKELCTEFDVARGTVRQALQKLEMEGYLRREQGRGTFVRLAEPGAAPDKAQANRLAFIVPYVRDSSVSTILIGFQQIAEQADYVVIFNHVNNDVRQQEQVVAKLVREGVAGIALYPVDSDHISGIEPVVRSGFPIVLIDRYLKRLSTDYVTSDHFGGAIRGVHYLVDQGHERVGFVTWLSPATSMEHRYLGYVQALRERGVKPDSSLVCHVEGYPTVDLTPLRSYLSAPHRPTAVLAANDQIAIALYRAAASVGLSVPEDLAIVGFDNLDISEHLDPPLTTIAQPFLKIGQTAAEVLIRRVEGDDQPFQQVTIAPDLIVRSSSLRLMRENA